MNEYLVARYGDPCRECGFVWGLEPNAALEIVIGVNAHLEALPRTLSETTNGTWGAAGYVAHLADTIHIWAVRVATASLDSHAQVVVYDEGVLGDVMGYDRASLEGSLWALERAVEDWRAALSVGTPGVCLQHPEQGPITIDDAQRILAHEVHHHTADIWNIHKFSGPSNAGEITAGH